MSFPFSFWKTTAGGGGASYLVSEDFEETGTPTAGTWSTVLGTPNYDYTTSPAPLAGSHSLGNPASTIARVTFTAQSDVWAYMMFSTDNRGANPYLMSLQNSSSANVCRIRILTNGNIRVYHGSSTSSDAGTVVNGSIYHLWVHYKVGSGANGEAEAYLSATDTIPGSPTVSLVNGNATTNADRWVTEPTASTINVYDKLRISASAIGSSPT